MRRHLGKDHWVLALDTAGSPSRTAAAACRCATIRSRPGHWCDENVSPGRNPNDHGWTSKSTTVTTAVVVKGGAEDGVGGHTRAGSEQGDSEDGQKSEHHTQHIESVAGPVNSRPVVRRLGYGPPIPCPPGRMIGYSRSSSMPSDPHGPRRGAALRF